MSIEMNRLNHTEDSQHFADILRKCNGDFAKKPDFRGFSTESVTKSQ